ncbi:unnamed protein product, partial [Closterium sp. NIES-53]
CATKSNQSHSSTLQVPAPLRVCAVWQRLFQPQLRRDAASRGRQETRRGGGGRCHYKPTHAHRHLLHSIH